MSSDRTEVVLRSGRFDKLTVHRARALIDSEYSLDRVPVNERYYFGCIGGPGHGFHGNHRNAAHSLGREGSYNTMIAKLGFDKIDGGLQPDPRRNGEKQGEALLSHSKTGWTALGFWDRSVDKRGACNSSFFVDQRLSFEEMLADAQEHWPKIFARFDFPIVDVTNAGDGAERPAVDRRQARP